MRLVVTSSPHRCSLVVLALERKDLKLRLNTPMMNGNCFQLYPPRSMRLRLSSTSEYDYGGRRAWRNNLVQVVSKDICKLLR